MIQTDVVLAGNMGDAIWSIHALHHVRVKGLGIPPYLEPLFRVLAPYVPYESISVLPDNLRTAQGAKGMSWRGKSPEYFKQYGLDHPVIMIMTGSGDHLINRAANKVKTKIPLPTIPPLQDMRGEIKGHIVMQSEVNNRSKNAEWLRTIEWPLQTIQVRCGYPDPVELSNQIHFNKQPTIEDIKQLIELVRTAKLVVSVSSFTGVLSAAMGVPTIMCHNMNPTASGVWVYRQHDVRNAVQLKNLLDASTR